MAASKMNMQQCIVKIYNSMLTEYPFTKKKEKREKKISMSTTLYITNAKISSLSTLILVKRHTTLIVKCI